MRGDLFSDMNMRLFYRCDGEMKSDGLMSIIIEMSSAMLPPQFMTQDRAGGGRVQRLRPARHGNCDQLIADMSGIVTEAARLISNQDRAGSIEWMLQDGNPRHVCRVKCQTRLSQPLVEGRQAAHPDDRQVET